MKLHYQRKDGSSDWIDLKHLEDSNPIELTEYAVANRIQEEPTFKWWVTETLQAQNRLIWKVKCQSWKTSHILGVRLPNSIQEALQFDRELGSDFWWKAIQKETVRVEVAL
jgi:hypothetical protein